MRTNKTTPTTTTPTEAQEPDATTPPNYRHRIYLLDWGINADKLRTMDDSQVEAYVHGDNIRAMFGEEQTQDYDSDAQRELRARITEARDVLLRGTPRPAFPFNPNRHGEAWRLFAAAALGRLCEGLSSAEAALSAADYADALCKVVSLRTAEYDEARKYIDQFVGAWEDANK